MIPKIKLRELVKPQKNDQNEVVENLVVPFCSKSYSANSNGTTSCPGTYTSTGFWCTTKPAEEDEVLL